MTVLYWIVGPLYVVVTLNAVDPLVAGFFLTTLWSLSQVALTSVPPLTVMAVIACHSTRIREWLRYTSWSWLPSLLDLVLTSAPLFAAAAVIACFFQWGSAISLAVVAEATARSMALFAVAAIITSVLHQSSAALRHRVWMLATLCATVLPIMPSVLQLVVPPVAPELMGLGAVFVETLPPQGVPDIAPSVPSGSSIPWPALLLAAWVVGAVMVGAFFVVVNWKELHRPYGDGSGDTAPRAWLGLLDSEARCLGVSPDSLHLMRMRFDHNSPIMPQILAYLESVILLPAVAVRWSNEVLRNVLRHEIAHARRRDNHANLLVQIACTVYWMNPMVWYLRKRVRIESDVAADRLVLDKYPSLSAENYLRSIHQALQSMKGATTPLGGAALAQDTGSDWDEPEFGRRMMRIYDARERCAPGRVLQCAVMAMTLVAAVALMPMGPQPKEVGQASAIQQRVLAHPVIDRESPELARPMGDRENAELDEYSDDHGSPELARPMGDRENAELDEYFDVLEEWSAAKIQSNPWTVPRLAKMSPLWAPPLRIFARGRYNLDELAYSLEGEALRALRVPIELADTMGSACSRLGEEVVLHHGEVRAAHSIEERAFADLEMGRRAINWYRFLSTRGITLSAAATVRNLCFELLVR